MYDVRVLALLTFFFECRCADTGVTFPGKGLKRLHAIIVKKISSYIGGSNSHTQKLYVNIPFKKRGVELCNHCHSVHTIKTGCLKIS